MGNHRLGLEITDHARIPYASLGSDDRRDVDAWLDHLRDWHNDEVIRSKARRLRGDEEIYIVPTNNVFLSHSRSLARR